ncbi:NAD-dependent epimerase/dehydratase family protein [Pseudalkalibacillus hwajinpoensis]|uniref:NAD-dependent epimerase/dehydratase family protein n=1 Tax=Guptibacillus hwajinpoensis TaxID=208199 RepID=UPI00325B147E
MKEKPSVLITGAGGFTGHHACRYFLEKGWDVRAVVRKNRPQLSELGISICDLTDKHQVKVMIEEEQPDFVLHLAGLNSVASSWKNPITSIEANILSTLYLLEAIRIESHQTRIVVIGSALQYDPALSQLPEHPYSFSKTMQMQIAEIWAHLFGMNIIMAKPSNLIGPGPSNGVCSIIASKIVQMERKSVDRTLYLNDLSIQRDFLDVRDVVKAYEILLTCGEVGKTYEVGSGKSCSLQDVVQQVKTLTDVQFTVETKKAKGSHAEVAIKGQDMIALGWTPTISLRSSLNDTLEHFRKHIS